MFINNFVLFLLLFSLTFLFLFVSVSVFVFVLFSFCFFCLFFAASLEYVTFSAMQFQVFTPECMIHYLRIFNFLWRAKRMEYCLTEMWKQQMTNRKMLKSLPGNLFLRYSNYSMQFSEVCLELCQTSGMREGVYSDRLFDNFLRKVSKLKMSKQPLSGKISERKLKNS